MANGPGPGTPKLLRAMNDRAALELLIAEGPLTRTQIGGRTGLSKVTASQLLARLEQRGLVEVVGERASGRGPNAALYAVVPGSAYVAGLQVGRTQVTVGIADITGQVVSEVTVDPTAADPVMVVCGAVATACQSAGVTPAGLRACVLGAPGAADPRTGQGVVTVESPPWHWSLHDALRAELRGPVLTDSDVNLVAVAEQAYGAATGSDTFALVCLDHGVALAAMLDGRLHHGMSGNAGQLGCLPVPGALPGMGGRGEPGAGGRPALVRPFGALVGADAVRELACAYGFHEATAAACVRAAAGDEGYGGAFLDELATRLSHGVAAVTIVLDPDLLVLAGAVGRAGGVALARRVEAAVAGICSTRPRVTVTEVEGNPVLRGALHAALIRAREEVFSSTTDS